MRDPLVAPLIAIIAGITTGRWLESSRLGLSVWDAGWPAVAFVALALGAKTRWLRAVCVASCLFFVGAFAQTWHRPGPRPVIDASSRETVGLEGCVVEPSAISPDREKFTLELSEGARATVTLLIQPDRNDNAPPVLQYGQRVALEARIRSPRNFRNPGAFDYENYLARQHIYWTAAMRRGNTVEILPGECGWRTMKALFAIRGAALLRIDKLYRRDSYSSGMMRAILLGDTANLEKVWTENFRRTGTFHALVISGTHVAVLAGVLLALLRLFRMPEMPALMLTGAAVWLYALVSGFTPPVARAAAGFSLYLIARLFFRRGRVLNLLAAVAIVFLLWDPAELLDASFQLSFLSVAAIGALAAPLLAASWQPLAHGLRGINDLAVDVHLPPKVAQFRVELRLVGETIRDCFRWMGISPPVRWCVQFLASIWRTMFLGLEIAAISAVMQIGLALPMAEYFHRISFTGLTANLVIAPLLELVVPLGFLAIFTQWPWAAALAGWLLKLAARAADWHARLEPNWRIADPPTWLTVGFGGTLLFFAAVIYLERDSPIRWLRWPLFALVAALFGLLLWQPWPARVRTGELELTSIDVGQGDSLLLVFPEGKRVVIDSGGLLQYGDPKTQRKPNLNIGEDVVSPYLWSRGIQRLDVLVATHAHEDHIGGAAALLENFRPAELWVGANPSRPLLDRAAQLGVNVVELREGDPFRYSGALLEVLSPAEDYVADKIGNNDSLALRIDYGRNSFLLTGDMESPMEYRLLGEGRLRHADVLKVGHHGSRTSTTEPFLDAVSPSIALISAGFENSFGHPHPSVMQRLRQRHVAIVRTDQDGLTTVHSDGRRLRFETNGETDVKLPAFGWAPFNLTTAAWGPD
jgi:competence protein ComEC